VALACLALPCARAQQTTGATFGQVVSLGGTPSDIVLDESRNRLYIVNQNANRVDILDISANQVVNSIYVGSTPLAAAMSMDNSTLFVTNSGNPSLSVINLANGVVTQTVQLPSTPQGVEVGADGRALVSMVGTGVVSGVPQGTLSVYDPVYQQLIPVSVPALPSTPAGLPAVPSTRPVTTFPGKLLRTPDGQRIVGVLTPTNATTYIFVYETASATVLMNRTSAGQSSVLSMAPDGAHFMAGLTMYDTATLGITAQYNNAMAPFAFNAAFSILQNIGGSTFSPDGSTLYSAFNVAPLTTPTPRPQSSTLLISDPSNLAIKLGIKLPESIVAKMVITADGTRAWGMSESGLIYMPLGHLYDYPILQPETTAVFLAQDQCNRGLASGALKINNLGAGKLTFSVVNTNAALTVQVSSGVAPSTVTFTMDPGRSGVVRQPGTNLWTGAGTQTGSPLSVTLASPEAINVPNTIQVYMNYRQPDQRGVIYPVPTTPNNNSANTGAAASATLPNEGLEDMVLDEPRGRLYISNSGYNRIEVFDLAKQRFTTPIPVGPLPHQMAMSTDGSTLYVGNTGGESISVVDLDQQQVVGSVVFPPIPRSGTQNLVYPRAIAMGLAGLQVIMSNGTQWKAVGNQLTVRPANSVTPTTLPTTAGAPAYGMVATPDNQYIITLAGNGTAYLYDATADTYTASRLLFGTTGNPIQGYYGVLGAGPQGAFYLANGLVLNSALAVIGGTATPGVTTNGAVQRNIAAAAPLNDHQFVLMTTPVRQNITTATRDDSRATLQIVDLNTGNSTLAGVAPENPVNTALGTTRINVTPRQMVVDSKGTAYAISLSGLSVMPLSTPPAPQIAAGARGILNSSDGTQNIRPGSFITITGTNLASTAVADLLPPPTVLGGTCVTFNDIALPLLQTSSGQIQAQVPDTLATGTNVVVVRSLATAQASDPLLVTVQKAAPGQPSQGSSGSGGSVLQRYTPPRRIPMPTPVPQRRGSS